MIVLYEPICSGPEHAPFNAALVATVTIAYPCEAVAFFAEREHLACVREMLQQSRTTDRVEWRALDIPRRHERRRFLKDLAVCATVFQEAAHLSASHVIACSCNETSVIAIRLHSMVRPTAPIVSIVHHGKLATMMGSRSTRAVLSARWPRSLRHIVLGCNIRRSVLQQLPSLAHSMVAIRHPYMFRALAPQTILDTHSLRFGFLGLGSTAKGVHRFGSLATAFPAVEWEIIGRLTEEHRHDKTLQGLLFNNSEGPLKRACYEDRVGRLSYAVFPYEPSDYELVSSGAILDAFSLLKPCIVLRNSLFEEYFESMGDIGYLCEDSYHMHQTVRDIIRSPPVDRYAAQCENISRRRTLFEPLHVAASLRAVFETSGPKVY
jgi:hypothetical protein